MIKIIGGDFKKNGAVKLIRQRGEIETLILPTGFMQTKLYVPKNIQSLTQEGQVGRNTLLNITFTDGKNALMSATAKDAEALIAVSFTVAKARAQVKTGNSNRQQVSPDKQPSGSVVTPVIMLVILFGLIPALMSMFAEDMGYTPVVIASLAALVYLFCLWKPLPIPFGVARWKSIAVVGILGFGIWTALVAIDMQAELLDLKNADPVAYLAKLKDLGNEKKWLEELRHLDPKTYAKEKALIEQREARKKEAEKLAKRKRAQEKAEREKEIAERERCGDELTAYTYATILIEPMLKNPDGADFQSAGKRVYMIECAKWKVQSTFDGTNGFGATIRTHYSAIVRRVAEDYWVMEDLKTW